jgi:hypothetical protein
MEAELSLPDVALSEIWKMDNVQKVSNYVVILSS